MTENPIKFDREFKFSKPQNAPDVEIFDPPMCCPTGMCGPTVDQTLLDVSDMIWALRKEGLRVERYQMSTDPQAFLANPEVMRLVREKQTAALPIVLLRGKIVTEGRYPKLAEIQSRLAGDN